ncbi:MAG: DUF4870 domain-containing protein [Patescibacteria group bacterium]
MNPENNQNQQNTAPINQQANLPPKHNALMAALSYVGPLVIVSYLTSKDDSFVKFHIKQGLVLFVIEVAIWVIGMFFWMLWPLFQIINLVTLILSIVGIVHAIKGAEKRLPLVGKFSEYFKI